MPDPIPESVIGSVKANTTFLSLLRGYGLSVSRRGSAAVEPTTPQRRELLAQALQRMEDSYAERPEGKQYLEGRRGLRMEGIEVGYCPPTFGQGLTLEQRKELVALGLLTAHGRPHFSGCVVFPLRDTSGALTGLYGRNIRDDGRCYMRGQRSGVFALHEPASDTVTITESIIDAISVHNAGGGSVLALHGENGFTPTHRQWLIENSINTVLLLLDGDQSGREAAARLANQLRTGGHRTHVVELPAGEDPNSYFSFSAHGLAELKRLPGYPSAAPDVRLRLEQCGEELVARSERIVYTVHGLSAGGPERLRVTIKAALAADPKCFYIDTVDLYQARGRRSFVEGLTGQLGGSTKVATTELHRLIGLLERERPRQ